MRKLLHTIEKGKETLTDGTVILKSLRLNGELSELRLVYQQLWNGLPYFQLNGQTDILDALVSEDYQIQVKALVEILATSDDVIWEFAKLADDYYHPFLKLKFHPEGQIDMLSLLTQSAILSKWNIISGKIDTALYGTANYLYHKYPPLFGEEWNNFAKMFIGVSKPNKGFKPCATPTALIDAIELVKTLVKERQNETTTS